MPIAPEQYGSTAVRDLLEAAARGHAPIDHRFLHALFQREEESIEEIGRFQGRDWEADAVELEDDLILIARHLGSPRLLPFLVDRLRGEADDPSDDLIEAICAHGAEAVDPLLALDAELDSPSEIPFLLASLGVADDRIAARIEQLKATDPDEAEFCADVYQATGAEPREPEPFDIFEMFPDEEEPAFDVMAEADLKEFLSAEDPRLRGAAAASVPARTNPTDEVIERLKTIAAEDPEPAVRGAAWQSLAILVEDEEFLERMLARVANPSCPGPERSGLTVGLVVVSSDERVAGAVNKLYQDPATRESALEAVWRSKDRRYAPLAAKHLEDPDPDLRHHAILAVGHLEMKGELKRLENLFADEEFRATALMSYALATPTRVSPAYMRSAFRKVEELAGGFDSEEADLVRQALDHRLELNGFPPMFESEETGFDEEAE